MDGYKVSMDNLDINSSVLFDVETHSFKENSLQSGSMYEIVVYAVEDGITLEGGSDPFKIITGIN